MLRRVSPIVLATSVFLSAWVGSRTAMAQNESAPPTPGPASAPRVAAPRSALGFERPAEKSATPAAPASVPAPAAAPAPADAKAKDGDPKLPDPTRPETDPNLDPAEQARIKKQLEAIAKQNEEEANRPRMPFGFNGQGQARAMAQANVIAQAQALARAMRLGPDPFYMFDFGPNPNPPAADPLPAPNAANGKQAATKKSSKRSSKAKAKAALPRRLGANPQPPRLPMPFLNPNPNFNRLGIQANRNANSGFQGFMNLNGRQQTFNNPFAYQQALRAAGMGGRPPMPFPPPPLFPPPLRP